METSPEHDTDSGYDASNETATETTSPQSQKSSTTLHMSAMPSHIVELRLSNDSLRQIDTNFSSCKSLVPYSDSSSSPEMIKGSMKDTRSHQEEQSSTPSASSSNTSTSAHQSVDLPQPIMRIGMTAREVAERAQDATLIRMGAQKTPAQLLQKVKRASIPEGGCEQQSNASCFDCQLKKLHCSHVVTSQGPMPSASTHQALQGAINLPSPNTCHHKEVEGEETSAGKNPIDATERETGANAIPSRQRRPPSEWQERREKEYSKSSDGQRLKASGGKVQAERTVIAKKKGRPVGWRKGLGLSYDEVKRLSMKAREELIEKHGLKK